MKLRFEPVRRLCQEAVENDVAPGFVLLVASGGRVQFHEAFGWRQRAPRQLPAFPDTVYDVASLTKAVVTSVLVMKQVEHGALELDEPVAMRLPEFEGPGRGDVTLRQLLSHSSGLPAHRPYWRQVAAAASERWAITLAAAREPLEYSPGTLSVYSDLGFILLGALLERASELRLDTLAARELFGPLGLASATFVNLSDVDARARLLAERSVAATQQSPERGHVVLGEVDDANAYAMGGVAGHAGLFSDAADLSTIAAALVDCWKGSGTLVAPEIVREFWAPAGVPGSTWRLGWDGPAAQGSQAGARLPRAAVGHLGFTGCSLWIDPERETWIVLLANRVHPSVPTSDQFRSFRPRVHDAALEALGQ
ncbi:MAG TPA: serine hydrolase domain-containing protein [Polyangia bacterium]|jgi:CubicO group peptidase (beta-lactamase class C family)|nr:serine hydrolase domain-containing protein [Polyangia bacterium]